MSVKVELDELAARLDEYGFAYLVTVSDAGAAHVIAVTPRLTADGVVADALGRHSIANATAHPAVTMVWPPTQAGGYSLIVDGTATVGDESITVSPTRAVLHRPAPGADGTASATTANRSPSVVRGLSAGGATLGRDSAAGYFDHCTGVARSADTAASCCSRVVSSPAPVSSSVITVSSTENVTNSTMKLANCQVPL